MSEVTVVVRAADGGAPEEHYTVNVGHLPGRGWWLELEGGGVAEVQDVRVIAGDRVAFAQRRASIPPSARTIHNAYRPD